MLRHHPRVKQLLNQRNQLLAPFWFSDPDARSQIEAELLGKKALMVDADDTFTEMLSQQLTALGLNVQIVKCMELEYFSNPWDLVVMGPGPGDPRNLQDRRIARMHALLSQLLVDKRPFFAVCLSHQILSLQLGLSIERKAEPKQGMQSEINLYGTPEWVGFYNTYAAQCESAQAQQLERRHIEVCRDLNSHEVHSCRGPHFSSVQFHPESLLTRRGTNIIAASIKGVISK